METDVPPDLAEGVYQARALEGVDVLYVFVPRTQGTREACSVVGAGEHQDAGRVHIRVLPLPERGVDREGEHVRHVFAQTVEVVDRLVPAVDGVVDVQGERVVAPDQPPQLLLQSLVVGLVDYLLLPPVTDRMRPTRTENASEAFSVPEQDAPAQ